MPSSPELAEASTWQPVALGGAAAVRPQPAPVLTALGAVTTGGAPAVPAPFVLSERIGVPPAVLADARRVARGEGYADGYASGMAQVRDRAAAEDSARRSAAEEAAGAARTALANALDALQTAGAAFTTRAGLEFGRLEQVLLDSAYSLAETLVGSVLADADLRGRAAVQRVLDLAPESLDTVTVALNPADHAMITGGSGATAVAVPATVRLVADPAVAPGDAIAHGPETTIESRLSDALGRVREVLGR